MFALVGLFFSARHWRPPAAPGGGRITIIGGRQWMRRFEGGVTSVDATARAVLSSKGKEDRSPNSLQGIRHVRPRTSALKRCRIGIVSRRAVRSLEPPARAASGDALTVISKESGSCILFNFWSVMGL